MKKFLMGIIGFMMVLIHTTPAGAEIQGGIDFQLQNGLSPAAVKVDWWVTDRWGLRGGYNWLDADYYAVLLYKKRLGPALDQYSGVAVRDLTGSRGSLSFGEKLELVAGVELELGKVLPGISTALEVKLNPGDLFGAAEQRSGFTPYLGVTLNYRFSTIVGSEDEYLLAKLITAEAEGEPYEGQLGVGAVVVNRVKSPNFPNTIREVIYQKNQFSSLPKLPQTVPTAEALRAAREAIRGKDPVNGALFFYNPALSSLEGLRFFATANLQVTARIGNHIFLK